MNKYLDLFRVKQYVKNLFIFLPLFFGMKAFDVSALQNTVLAFINFCIVASAIYIINDYKDIEEDRIHPIKRTRPLASGSIKTIHAIAVMVVLIIAGTLFSFYLNISTFILIYIALSILYTIKLKHIPIIDVTVIAIGFVIRIFVGGQVAAIDLSVWIVSITFLLALFLAFAKRRDDLILYLKTGEKHRKVIDGYNIDFLNICLAISATMVIVSYIMYSISSDVVFRHGGDKTYLSTIFVVVGMLRYLQLTFVAEKSGSPTDLLLKDSFLHLTIILWLAAIGILLYV